MVWGGGGKEDAVGRLDGLKKKKHVFFPCGVLFYCGKN
jgi:hypothetical protein